MKRKQSNNLRGGCKVQAIITSSGRIARPPPPFKPPSKFTTSYAHQHFDPEFRLLLIEDYSMMNLDGWALSRYEIVQLEGVLVSISRNNIGIWCLELHAPTNVNEVTRAYCFPAQLKGLPATGSPIKLVGKYRSILPGGHEPVLHVFSIH